MFQEIQIQVNNKVNVIVEEVEAEEADDKSGKKINNN
jgi:hypothetical protein